MSDLQSIDLWMKPRIDYGPWAEIELVKSWLAQVPTVDEATLFQWFQAAEGATSETPEPDDGYAQRGDLYAAILRKLVGADPTTDPAQRKDKYATETAERGEWRAGAGTADATDWTTQYANRADLANRSAGAGPLGEVLDPDGKAYDGSWGWVVDDETGLLMLFDPNRFYIERPDGSDRYVWTQGVKEFFAQGYNGQGYVLRATHHTSPVAGAPVTGAGMMTLDSGYIVEITDQSGHYQPTAEQTYAAMQSMEDASFHRPAGAGYRDATVTLAGYQPGDDAGGVRPTGKQWVGDVRDSMADDPAGHLFPTGDLQLSADQFRQTLGNEEQARWKDAVNFEIDPESHDNPWASWAAGFFEETATDSDRLNWWHGLDALQRADAREHDSRFNEWTGRAETMDIQAYETARGDGDFFEGLAFQNLSPVQQAEIRRTEFEAIKNRASATEKERSDAFDRLPAELQTANQDFAARREFKLLLGPFSRATEAEKRAAWDKLTQENQTILRNDRRDFNVQSWLSPPSEEPSGYADSGETGG